MDSIFNDMLVDLESSIALENLASGKKLLKNTRKHKNFEYSGDGSYGHTETAKDVGSNQLIASISNVVTQCRSVRRKLDVKAAQPQDDRMLSQSAEFTDHIALKPFEPFLHYVPRIVNVVTLAEAFPMPGSGCKLPLDLNYIASRCTGAYFAPKRFSAVQLAYTNPRARVLIFHTGRLVGTGNESNEPKRTQTNPNEPKAFAILPSSMDMHARSGTSGPMAARLAISRAQQQLSIEAGIHLHTRNFSIINQVGACNLNATLKCNEFADAHPHDSHYDQQSFVGLAWRPANEQICCEIYSTGRANLPGSTRERDMHDSWSCMLPELLRFSSQHHLLQHIPEDRKAVHRTVLYAKPPARESIMDGLSGWKHADSVYDKIEYSQMDDVDDVDDVHVADELADADLELLGL